MSQIHACVICTSETFCVSNLRGLEVPICDTCAEHVTVTEAVEKFIARRKIRDEKLRAERAVKTRKVRDLKFRLEVAEQKAVNIKKQLKELGVEV